MSSLDTARRCGEAMWENDKASHALGIEVDIPEAGSAIATMRVREDMLNGFGICHGGLLVALADTAFAFACNAYNEVTVAASTQTEFLRPAYLDDQLVATAAEDHRGRKSGYYSVEIRNRENALIALFRGRSVSKGKAILVDQK